MNQALDIIACGHLCLDLLPQMQNLRLEALASPGRLFEVGPMGFSTGGSVSNTGLALQRLGVNVRLMSNVGDDQISRLILDFLQRRDPVIIEYIRVLAGQNGSYTLVLSPKDVDRMFLQFAGTNATFSSADIDYTVISRAKILHLGYPPLLPTLIASDGIDLARLFARAKESGVATSLDMSFPDPTGASGQINWRTLLRRTLPHVDIFIPSLEEILFMLRREDFDRWGGNVIDHVSQQYLDSLVGELLSMGSCIAGVKLGAYGIYLRTSGVENFRRLARLAIDVAEWADKSIWHPAFAVDVAGTTGAGDSAYAGLLTAMLKGMSVESAARWACAVGACNVEAIDSTSGIQSWHETERRLDAGWEVRSFRIRES